MKLTLLKILLIMFIINSHVGYSQDLIVSEVQSNELLHFAQSIDDFQRFKSDSTAIKILESGYVALEPVPGLEGMDVVLHKLLIMINRITPDERLVMNNYWVDGRFLNPRDYQFNAKTKELSFNVGLDTQPKKIILKVSKDGRIEK